MLASTELYLHADFYADATWSKEEHKGPFGKESLFTSMLSSDAMTVFDETWAREKAIKIYYLGNITSHIRTFLCHQTLYILHLSSC
jgi:hypothetical protein